MQCRAPCNPDRKQGKMSNVHTASDRTDGNPYTTSRRSAAKNRAPQYAIAAAMTIRAYRTANGRLGFTSQPPKDNVCGIADGPGRGASGQ
ncbi:hypothetical protein BRAS3843_1180003 [Bradyrhizobium sp. STM 3843]|nr:hypothetical protein BRAS3843_1180003 [Bradyrhizobium sp. STM 3843]